jgi:hypothetical protein
MPEYRHPPGAIAPESKPVPCAWRLDLEATPGDSALRLRAKLTNVSDEPIREILRHPCATGLLRIEGFPGGARGPYDPLHHCNVGPCVEPVAEFGIELAPGDSQQVLDVTLPYAGDTCRDVLKPGEYHIWATPAWEHPGQPVLCGQSWADFSIPDRGQWTQPLPPPPKQRPADCPPRPVCAYACLNGFPKTEDERGCPICGCTDDGITTQPAPQPAPFKGPLPKRPPKGVR